jgi:hypothetical protein
LSLGYDLHIRMKQRSPTVEGFQAVLRRPSFGLAEITWRWSVGFASVSLLALATFEYLHTLPVSGGDLFLLGTRQPTLIYQAIQHIFRGSAARLVWSSAILVTALALGWMVVAALGRAATVNALLDYFRDSGSNAYVLADGAGLGLNSLIGLNLLRAGTAFAALVGCVGAALVAGGASSKTHPAPGSVMLIFFTLALFIFLTWSVLNWLLSLASVFVIARRRDTFGAIASAVALLRSETGSLFAAGLWFGIAHVAAFVVATSIVAFPLGFAGVLPGSLVVGGVLLVTLLYFATVDFLYTGRLAAYVAILELPDAPLVMAVPASPPPPSPEPAGGIDREELILSDTPIASGPTGS